MASREDIAASTAALLDQIESVDQRLSELQSALHRSDRLATLGLAAAMLAHEFNNLLTPIKMATGAAKAKRGDPAAMARAVEVADKNATRATEIADSILRLAGEPRSPAEAADVLMATDDALNCLGGELHQDRVEVLCDVAPGLKVPMAQGALQQVLLNLILNARDAMRPRGGRLSIRTDCSTGNIRIIVEDTGRGMAPEELAEAFRAFRRREESGGVGLGLTICQKLVETAGGEIRAASEVGVGTRFEIGFSDRHLGT
ncbi:MAG: HAMP domain-containing histidine kinase [Phycisphaerales bacterium]|nr:HAMP domain-containing histidine kinase [Phycisphaerales bacterium]